MENPYQSPAAVDAIPAIATPPAHVVASGILATRRGRLAAFFLMYITEGVPLGFTATALATIMSNQGVGPGEIGAFVASLYLPWSLKWIMGPIVDLVYSTRLGRRRAWIVGCQTLMSLTLLVAMGVDFVGELPLFSAIIFAHNAFSATMDVAIDALACEVLPSDERSTANGLMFAGQYLGIAVGGAGVLELTNYIPVTTTFLLVIGVILAVLICVTLRLIEPGAAVIFGKKPNEPKPVAEFVKIQPPRPNVFTELRNYLRTLVATCFGSRPAILGLAFALLPAGAYSLSLVVKTTLAVELGLDKSQIARMTLVMMIVAAAGCVIGGVLADRLGRRTILTVAIVAMGLPTLWLAWRLHDAGWIMPVPKEQRSEVLVPDGLVAALWIALLAYSFPQGLMYGSRSPIYMDLCRPEIAAAQFTAYMSVMNLAIAYSARWQGAAVEAWGYPTTLWVDAVVGVVCLVPLALMGGRKPHPQPTSI